jgi:hypothetical protein
VASCTVSSDTNWGDMSDPVPSTFTMDVEN